MANATLIYKTMENTNQPDDASQNVQPVEQQNDWENATPNENETISERNQQQYAAENDDYEQEEDDSDDDGDDDDESGDWGTVDPLEHPGPPSDMDPSAPGSAV